MDKRGLVKSAFPGSPTRIRTLLGDRFDGDVCIVEKGIDRRLKNKSPL